MAGSCPAQETPAGRTDAEYQRYLAAKTEAERAIALRKKIQQEARQLPRGSWAGVYGAYDFHHDLWSNRFAWTPQQGFVRTFAGDAEFFDAVDYGKVFDKGDRLGLQPASPGDEVRDDPWSAFEFIKIRWGACRFLVPPAKVPEFLADAHARNLASVHAYFHQGDPEPCMRGSRPQVPAAYAKYNRAVSVEVKVIGVRRENDSPPHLTGLVVELDAGRARGLVEGMTLWVVMPRDVPSTLRVTRVGERSAEAVPMVVQQDKEPQAGWRYSSRCTPSEPTYPYDDCLPAANRE